MDPYKRHKIVWQTLTGPLDLLLKAKFKLSHEDLEAEGPMLLVSNHVCAWDPLFVAMSLRKRPAYYVASEHLFRLGPVTKLLQYLVEPIPRRKAASGSDTVRACLRHLKAGRSVALFAEGEQCWDGLSQSVFPATGKLARTSGASLATFRIEGGYLSCPRWCRHARRGAVHVRPVKVYPPEQLKAMTPKEIDEAINRDISESAWERQRINPVPYRGKRRAERLERMLYLCPRCGKIGGLRSEGDRLFCSCGGEWRYTEYGLFAPGIPFPNLAAWDAWERERLRQRDFSHGEALFSDLDLELRRVGPDHAESFLTRGVLRQYEDRLECGGYVFPMESISDMAAVLCKLLLFSFEGQYYQIRTDRCVNIRKYYEFWKVK